MNRVVGSSRANAVQQRLREPSWTLRQEGYGGRNLPRPRKSLLSNAFSWRGHFRLRRSSLGGQGSPGIFLSASYPRPPRRGSFDMIMLVRSSWNPAFTAVGQLLVREVEKRQLPTIAANVAIRSVHVGTLKDPMDTVNLTPTAKASTRWSTGADLPELVRVP